jgi:acyl-CoA thioester hydrolase
MSDPALPVPASGVYIGAVHHFPIRVYYEDTDLSGIVYHANYLRFMERARSDMLRVIDIDQRGAIESGEGVYAVAEVNIRYLRPARLEDELLVRSSVTALKNASCTIHQEIWRGEELLIRADVTAAFITLDGRPKRQPAAWMDAFRRILAG